VSVFKKATKTGTKARVAFVGPAGSGKTWSALEVARHLVPGGRIALIDTERGSASKYADEFDFDEIRLETFETHKYIDAIQAAQREGYDVLIIDSLSHAWMGKGGSLDQVDRIGANSVEGGKFGAWRKVTPQHNALVDAILGAKLHVIATMRVKTEYTLEKDERTGKTAPKRVGLAPVQRDGLEYEFDLVGDIDDEHRLSVTKTRCSALANQLIDRPGRQLAETLRAWLSDAKDEAAPAEQPQAEPQRPAPAQAKPAPVHPETRDLRDAMHEGKAAATAQAEPQKQEPEQGPSFAARLAEADMKTAGAMADDARERGHVADLTAAYVRALSIAASTEELEYVARSCKAEALFKDMDRQRPKACGDAFTKRAGELRGKAA
jgi:hypothetical protein